MTPSDLGISTATIAQPSNFLAAAIAASQLDFAMRKSRQPRCTAAKSFVLAVMTPKPLDESRNFGRAILPVIDGPGGQAVRALAMVRS
jgi:hypothetical protein